MYRRILVPLDGSEASLDGLRAAIRLASDQRTRLVLLHVIDGFPGLHRVGPDPATAPPEQAPRAAARALLDRGLELAHNAQVSGCKSVRTAVESLAGTIVCAAVRTGCEMIVLGTHGHGRLQCGLLGSTADGVLRRSPLPVLLVPPQPQVAGRREAAC